MRICVVREATKAIYLTVIKREQKERKEDQKYSRIQSDFVEYLCHKLQT